MASSGRGMPSSYGSEMKGQDVGESCRRYRENMDKIFGKSETAEERIDRLHGEKVQGGQITSLDMAGGR